MTLPITSVNATAMGNDQRSCLAMLDIGQHTRPRQSLGPVLPQLTCGAVKCDCYMITDSPKLLKHMPALCYICYSETRPPLKLRWAWLRKDCSMLICEECGILAGMYVQRKVAKQAVGDVQDLSPFSTSYVVVSCQRCGMYNSAWNSFRLERTITAAGPAEALTTGFAAAIDYSTVCKQKPGRVFQVCTKWSLYFRANTHCVSAQTHDSDCSLPALRNSHSLSNFEKTYKSQTCRAGGNFRSRSQNGKYQGNGCQAYHYSAFLRDATNCYWVCVRLTCSTQ